MVDNIKRKWYIKVMVKLLFLIIFLSGCIAPSSTINKISLGMTKEEVIKKLGNPTSVSAQGGCEYLNYSLAEDLIVDRGTPYYVRLVDGKVESYGRAGDFGTTQLPEQKIKIELNQNIKEQ